jgi:hypothetical protein
LLYGTWLALSVIASGVLVLFAFKVLVNTKSVDYIDPLAFGIDFGLLILLALNSSFLSFESSSGAQTYNGDWYFTWIFWAMAFVDLMLALATSFIAAHNLANKRMYPEDTDLDLS